jgi:hypothetical protein
MQAFRKKHFKSVNSKSLNMYLDVKTTIQQQLLFDHTKEDHCPTNKDDKTSDQEGKTLKAIPL